MTHSYAKLAIALSLSFVVMFLLTMSMIREIDHFYWNLFPSAKANIALLGGFLVMFVVVLLLGRQEALVGDEQFLKSMIPHHSRAVLVCQESDLSDPEVIELCDQIIASQLEEIAQMEGILQRFGSQG